MPSAAIRTSWPLRCSRRDSMSRFMSLSSTSRILAMASRRPRGARSGHGYHTPGRRSNAAPGRGGRLRAGGERALGPRSRIERRPLPHRRAARAGRHGLGLPGLRAGPRPLRGAQGAAARVPPRPRLRRALQARGQGHRAGSSTRTSSRSTPTTSTEPRASPGWPCGSSDRAAVRSRSCSSGAAARRSRGRSRSCAGVADALDYAHGEGHRPPRRQAAERAARRGRPRLPRRLRHREDARVLGRPHRHRHDHRHPAVHGPGAGDGDEDRPRRPTSTRSASWPTRCSPAACRSRPTRRSRS